MSKILWIFFFIAFGVLVYLIVIGIKSDIGFVLHGVPSGLLLTVIYTCLWRICKTTLFAKKHPIDLFEKLMTMLLIAGCISVSIVSVNRAYDRRELLPLTTGLCYLLAAAAVCAYLEERLKSRRSAGEIDQAS